MIIHSFYSTDYDTHRHISLAYHGFAISVSLFRTFLEYIYYHYYSKWSRENVKENGKCKMFGKIQKKKEKKMEEILSYLFTLLLPTFKAYIIYIPVWIFFFGYHNCDNWELWVRVTSLIIAQICLTPSKSRVYVDGDNHHHLEAPMFLVSISKGQKWWWLNSSFP